MFGQPTNCLPMLEQGTLLSQPNEFSSVYFEIHIKNRGQPLSPQLYILLRKFFNKCQFRRQSESTMTTFDDTIASVLRDFRSSSFLVLFYCTFSSLTALFYLRFIFRNFIFVFFDRLRHVIDPSLRSVRSRGHSRWNASVVIFHRRVRRLSHRSIV